MRIAFWRAHSPSDPRWADTVALSFQSLVAHARFCGEVIDPVYCRTADELVHTGADLYAISSVTGCWPEALNVVRRLQSVWSHMPIVIGGPHITCLPESRPPGTYAVIGEGEPAFAHLVRGLRLGTITGGGELPRFARMRVSLANHLPICTETAPGHLMAVATRGCPYRCWFCCAWRCWRVKGSRTVTRFSPEHIAGSIGRYFRDRAPGGTVTFHDLTFATDPAWLDRLADMLGECGCPDHFHVAGCSFSAANNRPDILAPLKRMGIEWLGIGVESASPRLHRKLKPHLDIEQTHQLIADARSLGITVHGSFIIGTPGETPEDLQASLDFIERHEGRGFHQGGLFMFVPYPGTPAWAELSACGTVSADMDFGTLTNGADPERSRVFYCNEAMPYEQAVEYRRKMTTLCAKLREERKA